MKNVWTVAILLCVACTSSPASETARPAMPQESVLEADLEADLEAGLETRAIAPMTLGVSQVSVPRPALIVLRATPPVGTTRVTFYRNGTKFAEATKFPFVTQVVFARAERATVQFSAEAFGTLGKLASSAAVAVQVGITGTLRYVSGTGSEGNDGLSEAKPLRNIQTAVLQSGPGDTVLVMNGTYTQTQYPQGDIVTITKSGTASAWFALMAYPGHKPLLKSINWQAIKIMASYVLVQGFTIQGNRDAVTLEQARREMSNLDNPATSGQGISVEALYPDRLVRPHHVVIRRNTIFKCPGSGIGTGNADYVTIEDNVIWGNAWYSPYATSGISMYQNWNSDASTGYKMIVRRNMIYQNANKIPFFQSDPDPAKRTITDGNGIIVDDSRGTQNGSTLGAYKGRTLIENNVVFDNGGRGIHVFKSDNVDIVNNTTRHNSVQPETPEGEITTLFAGNVRVFNNIMVSLPNRPSITRFADSVAERDSQVFKRNMVDRGLRFDADASQNLIGFDPLITDPGNLNFRPVPDSPAIDKADPSLVAAIDFAGTRRPLGQAADLGAFEIR
jgi:parallel beta-helix repeat protein